MSPLEHDLQDALQAFLVSRNNGLLLLEVLRRAGLYRLPIPEEAAWALAEALRRYTDGQCRTLDEAFNVARAKGWNQSAAICRSRAGPKAISVAGEVYLMARRLNSDGLQLGKDSELWERIAAELNISAATAFVIYHEVKRERGE